MRYFVSIIILTFFSFSLSGQEYSSIEIDREIENVQPLTGIVFWPTNGEIETDAIALEYSYMHYDDVVAEKGVYDWSVVDELLDEMVSRNHQAVLRFRFTYPGRETTVPSYIKDLADYEETEGITEGKTTWFPDWTNEELQLFTIEFYKEYANRYDNDPRLAFVQTGFGLWAEYHIYDGPFVLGETFPSKEFQESFFLHLDTVFQETYWSISIDAASSTYSPFEEKPELKEIDFGLFDDSFMHQGHAGYNTTSWTFFDRQRYLRAPAGGEFSYYTTYDQQNVLNEHVGAHGIAFETFVENFQMSYINGNDQNKHQTLERIKAASMYMGYRFKVNSFKTNASSSIVEIENVGVAPFYYDAFVTVNGVRATESLKLLEPGETLTSEIASGGDNPTLTIESDRILPTQTIEYYGTINEPFIYVPQEIEAVLSTDKDLDRNRDLLFTIGDNEVIIKSLSNEPIKEIALFNMQGRLIYSLNTSQKSNTETEIRINSSELSELSGVFLLKSNLGSQKVLLDFSN